MVEENQLSRIQQGFMGSPEFSVGLADRENNKWAAQLGEVVPWGTLLVVLGQPHVNQ